MFIIDSARLSIALYFYIVDVIVQILVLYCSVQMFDSISFQILIVLMKVSCIDC